MPRDDDRPLPIARPVPRDTDDGVPVRRVRAARTHTILPVVVIGTAILVVPAAGALAVLQTRAGPLPGWHGMRWNESELLSHLSSASGQTWYYTRQDDSPSRGPNLYFHDEEHDRGFSGYRDYDTGVLVVRLDGKAGRRSQVTGLEKHLWYDWGRFTFTSQNRPMMETLKRHLPGGDGND